MPEKSSLLRTAVLDNIAWCSTVCAAHGALERLSRQAWANLAVSPPFYPNIITRERGSTLEVANLVPRIRAANRDVRWGIKDSFAELNFPDQDFTRVLTGHWFGGTIADGDGAGWSTVTSTTNLRVWANTWGSDGEAIFPSVLLSDPRIHFWYRGEIEAIDSGFIGFNTGYSYGVSNWFSVKNEPFAKIGVLQAAGSVSGKLPIVCWSSDDLGYDGCELTNLGPLSIWTSNH